MILQQLSEAVGLSGAEEAVRKIIREALTGHVDEMRTDTIGNLLILKRGTGKNLPRVMISGHMDEVGLIVTGIDSDGLVRFTHIGGVDDRILPALRVKIGADAINGVIMWTPIHRSYAQTDVKEASDLRIDIGAKDKSAAAAKVKMGDHIAFDSAFMEISDHTLRGKAFDDRVGCSLLVDILLAGPYPVDVLAAFTVQEEVGLRGAKVAARALQPDVMIALEGTTANDIINPNANPDDAVQLNPTCRLDGGPVLTVMDKSLIVPPRLLHFLEDTAKANGIPYQHKTNPGGGTDAGAVHLTLEGVPSGVVSVPCRYIHSPTALLRRNDYKHTLALMQAVLGSITWDAVRG